VEGREEVAVVVLDQDLDQVMVLGLDTGAVKDMVLVVLEEAEAGVEAVEVAVEVAGDPEVGREVEVEVEVEVGVGVGMGMEVEEEEEVVVGVEVEEEDLALALALALALVAGQVMALAMEEGKAKACLEHKISYLFFYITPFTVVFQNKIAGAHTCMNIACWRVIATMHACITINKVTFSNAINKRRHFNYSPYFTHNLSANPNQK